MIAMTNKGRPGERGAVLITGLIILVVMTIIGVTSMQTTVLEEKMAGNLRDRNVAFEAAEAGLQVALSYLEDLTEEPLADSERTNDIDIWPGCTIETCTTFGDEDTLVADGESYDTFAGVNALAGVSRQPLIAIEDRYTPPLKVEHAAQGRGTHFYTVSSLGFGASAQTRALLTTTIAKVYAW